MTATLLRPTVRVPKLPTSTRSRTAPTSTASWQTSSPTSGSPEFIGGWQRPRRSTSGSGSRRSGRPAIATSVLASAAGLFGLGAATTVFTGRSVLLAGSRQVLLGAAAATLTYVLGANLGTSVGG